MPSWHGGIEVVQYAVFLANLVAMRDCDPQQGKEHSSSTIPAHPSSSGRALP